MDLLIPGPAGDLEAVLWTPKDGGHPRADSSVRVPTDSTVRERADSAVRGPGDSTVREPVVPRAAVAVCHPHPLHGGTMNNTVVFRTARGLQLAGLAVLRFNFRGVGKSGGVHDGKGGEEGDLAAALDYLERTLRRPASEHEDVQPARSDAGPERGGVELWAAGFSFGSRTAASLAIRDPRVARVVLVTMPVLAYDCSFVRDLHKPGYLITAGRDQYGSLADVRRALPDLDPRLETDEIPDVDHFFAGKTAELQARVRGYAERALESRASGKA
jgi:alpha/beta superfamily hydrolase